MMSQQRVLKAKIPATLARSSSEEEAQLDPEPYNPYQEDQGEWPILKNRRNKKCRGVPANAVAGDDALCTQ